MFFVIYFGGMLFTVIYYISMTRLLPIYFAKANFFNEYDFNDWPKERQVKESRGWLMTKIYWLPLMLVWPWFWFIPTFLLLFFGVRGLFLSVARLATKNSAVIKVVHRMAGFTE